MDFKDGFKREMVRKLLLPDGKGATELSREIGVSTQTLYNWRDKYNHNNDVMSRKRRSGGLSAEEKTMILLEFARMAPAETGSWLRKKNLQSEHLKLWESELTTKNDTSQFKEEIRILRNKNKQIEKDLFRKDKALAELSAIVILQKKMADLFPQEKAP